MFFTQEDYKKIYEWISRNSIRDTEFNEALTPLDETDTITLVQNGANVRISLKGLVDQLFQMGVSDFLNITDKYREKNITLDQAIELIPYTARKVGQVITFLDTNNKWKIYQFRGELTQWDQLNLWEDILDIEAHTINSILPDEEDLTKTLPDDKGNSYLSLKDREYNPDDFSGLGRVILRKNIVEVEDPIYGKAKKNILYQDMINKENTIYIIQYDFTLVNDIIVPSNCVLKFDGGSISGEYTLTGSNTSIQAGLVKIFDIDVTLAGLWNVAEAYPEWFGAKGDSVTDDTNFIQKSVDCFNCVVLTKGLYLVSEVGRYDLESPYYQNIAYGILIKHNDRTIKSNNDSIIKLKNTTDSYYHVIRNKAKNFHLEGIHVIGDKTTQESPTEYGHCIVFVDRNASGSVINCEVEQAVGDCITCYRIDNIVIKDCKLHDSRRQGVSIVVGTATIENNEIYNISGTNPQFAIDFEGNAADVELGYHCNGIIKNNKCYNNAGGTIMLSRCTNNVTISDMVCERIEIDFHILDKVMIQNVTCNYLFAESREDVEEEKLFIDNSKIGTLYVGSNGNLSVVNSTINRFAGTVPYGSNKTVNLFNCVVTNAIEDYSRQYEESDMFSTFIVKNFICRNTTFAIRATRAIAFTSADNVSFTNCNFIVLTEETIPVVSGFSLINLSTTVKNAQFESCHFSTKNMLFQIGAIGVSCTELVSFCNCIFEGGDANSYYVFINSDYNGGVIKWLYNYTKDKSRDIINQSSKKIFKKYNVTIRTDTDVAESRGNAFPNNPDLYLGFPFYNTGIKIQTWYDGSSFREFDGAKAGVLRKGTFEDKPSSSDIYIGFKYFCTDKQTIEGVTNGIEIIHKGNDVWVDALGRVVF